MRLKDTLYIIGAILLASLVALAVLMKTQKLSSITSQSIDHFFDYTLRNQILPKTQVKSALLAHTISAFLMISIGVILWSLFRPNKKSTAQNQDYENVKKLLDKYSKSSEDYFKLWPGDKDYFWGSSNNGFIAYKIVGPIAFALDGPICPRSRKTKLIEEFINWARSRRLRTCFIPLQTGSLAAYESTGLSNLQIGAIAVIEIDTFLQNTAKDKWWRWQKNRAEKNGYKYNFSKPPHTVELIAGLKEVSDAWLAKNGRKERAFAMGYFDSTYINQCLVHYLKNSGGDIIAFSNQLPNFKPSQVTTVDLLRYLPGSDNAMPFLLLKTIENLKEENNYKNFDLGFVPFTAAKNPVIAIARGLSSRKFSSRGLEQFKNKFKPEWQPTYLAYDGDLGDLALIAANIERVMEL